MRAPQLNERPWLTLLPRLAGAWQGRISPAWEAIDAARHIFLLMAQPYHSVTCYEVGCRMVQWGGGAGVHL